MIKNLQNSSSMPKRVRRQTRNVPAETSVLDEVDSLLEEENVPARKKSIGMLKKEKKPVDKQEKEVSVDKLRKSRTRRKRQSEDFDDILDSTEGLGKTVVVEDLAEEEESVQDVYSVGNKCMSEDTVTEERTIPIEKTELVVYSDRFIHWHETCPMNGIYPALFAGIDCNGKDESLDADIEFNNAVISTISADEDVSMICPSIVLDDTEVEIETLTLNAETLNKEETHSVEDDFPPEETDEIEGFEMS